MKNILGFSFLLFSNVLFCQTRNNCFTSKLEKFIVYYHPNLNKIEELKSESVEEDFYTIMDDEAFYFANSLDFLNKHKIKIFNTSKKCIYLNKENKYLKIPDSISFGGFFIYKNREYSFINSIDFVDFIEKKKY